MRHKRIDIPLTLSDCEAMSEMPTLYKHGITMPYHDLHPFKLTKPTNGTKEESSRFELNGLSFQGKEVARVGFRNKNAFMLVRSGLPQQVEDAIQKRVMGMARFAKKGKRILKDEMDMMDRQIQEIMENYEAVNDTLNDPYLLVKNVIEMNPATAYNALAGELAELQLLSVENHPVYRNMTCVMAQVPQYKLSKVLFTFDYVKKGFWLRGAEVKVDGIKGMLARGAAKQTLDLREVKKDLEASDMNNFEVRVEIEQLLKKVEPKAGAFRYLMCPPENEGSGFGLLLHGDMAIASVRGYKRYYPTETRIDITPIDGMAKAMGVSGKKLNGMLMAALSEATTPNKKPGASVENEKGWVDELARAVQGTDFGYGV